MYTTFECNLELENGNCLSIDITYAREDNWHHISSTEGVVYNKEGFEIDTVFDLTDLTDEMEEKVFKVTREHY